jgi:multidrug efflux pump subunit AcrA (membrane-fusion protein)
MSFRKLLRSPRSWTVLALGAVLAVGCFGFGGEIVAWLQAVHRRNVEASERHHHGGHADEHEEHVPTVQRTVWNERLEVFVDHPFAVAGEPLTAAVHVSLASEGRPLAEGSATLILTRPGGGRLTASASEPTSPGVFLIEVTPPEAGVFQVQLDVDSPKLSPSTVRVALGTLQAYADEASVHLAEQKAAETQHEDVAFLKEQQWHARMVSTVVESRQLAERLVVPGRVIAPRFSEAVVPPPVAGQILPPPGGCFPRVGQRVRAGDVLAVIEPSVVGSEAVQLLVNRAQMETLDTELSTKQLEIEADVKATQLEFDLAKRHYERLRTLADEGVAAGRRAIEARYDVDQAEARLASLRDTLGAYAAARRRLADSVNDGRKHTQGTGLEGTLCVPLRSPISGTVIEVKARAGELTADGEPLLRIVDLERLYVEAHVSEYDLAKVEASLGASFRLSAYPDRLIPILGSGGGRLANIGATVDPLSRTVAVRYEVPNAEGLLRVGMYADVLIETARRVDVLAVPSEAVLDDNGAAVVFVQTGGESFERRLVTTGLSDGEMTEIREGLKAGERVIVRGAYSIRLSMLSGAMPEHHHH